MLCWEDPHVILNKNICDVKTVRRSPHHFYLDHLADCSVGHLQSIIKKALGESCFCWFLEAQVVTAASRLLSFNEWAMQ